MNSCSTSELIWSSGGEQPQPLPWLSLTCSSGASNHNTFSFCFLSSCSWLQHWGSSCSQEGEVGHIFLVRLWNLSVHHRHLKWVRCSRGFIFIFAAACATHPGSVRYTPRLWAGSGLTDAPSLEQIKRGRFELDRTRGQLLGFWGLWDVLFALVQTKGEGPSLNKRDMPAQKQMRHLSWSGLITVKQEN